MFLRSDTPPKVQIAKFLALKPRPADTWALLVPAGPGPVQNNTLLHAPLDPHKIVRFLKATSYYKRQKLTKEALMATLEALHPVRFTELAEAAESPPSASLLLAARVRFDCVCMLLGRWQWEHQRAAGVAVWRSLGYVRRVAPAGA